MPTVADRAIFAQVVIVVENTFSIRLAVCLPSTRLASDLEIGRLGRWQLIVALEDLYEIEIPNDIVARFETLGDIVHYLNHQMRIPAPVMSPVPPSPVLPPSVPPSPVSLAPVPSAPIPVSMMPASMRSIPPLPTQKPPVMQRISRWFDRLHNSIMTS